MDYLMRMLEMQNFAAELPQFGISGLLTSGSRQNRRETGSAAEISARLAGVQAAAQAVLARQSAVTAGSQGQDEREENTETGGAEVQYGLTTQKAEMQPAEAWSPEALSRYFERDARRYGGR